MHERPNERKKRFEAMYRTHYDEVLAYARRRAPEDVARDVVAETFLVAWRRLEAVPGQPVPWLIAVARRTLANQRRSARRRSSLEARLENETRVKDTAQPNRRDELDETPVTAAFRRLREVDQEVLALIAWDDLTYAQAAAVLGCSRVAFRIRLHRARARFGIELQRLESSPGSESGPTPVATAKEAR